MHSIGGGVCGHSVSTWNVYRLDLIRSVFGVGSGQWLGGGQKEEGFGRCPKGNKGKRVAVCPHVVRWHSRHNLLPLTNHPIRIRFFMRWTIQCELCGACVVSFLHKVNANIQPIVTHFCAHSCPLSNKQIKGIQPKNYQHTFLSISSFCTNLTMYLPLCMETNNN